MIFCVAMPGNEKERFATLLSKSLDGFTRRPERNLASPRMFISSIRASSEGGPEREEQKAANLPDRGTTKPLQQIAVKTEPPRVKPLKK